MPEEKNSPVSDELLKILACPLCKTGVELINTGNSEYGLKCPECNRVYPVRNGIPVMLTEEAKIIK